MCRYFIKRTVAVILMFVLTGALFRAVSTEAFTYRIENGGAVITGIAGGIVGKAVIPDTIGGYIVTGIDDWAFENNGDLTEITLSGGIEKIGDGAFAGCRNLVSISLPESLKSIGWDAFWNCSSLESAVLPGGVQSVGGFAFSYCSSLKSVSLGGGISKIGTNAFEECIGITDVYYTGGKFDRVKVAVAPGNVAINGALWHYGNAQKGTLAGDINGDGSRNNKDLTRFFQYLSDWEVAVDINAVDVNADEFVNNKDLTRLFQFLSDWDVEIY